MTPKGLGSPARGDSLDAALEAGDVAAAARAIERLGERATRQDVERLQEFLMAGQPDALADRAVRALGDAQSAHALPTLARFAHHRRAQARQLAYRALAQIPDPAVADMLGAGLGDSDPGVRATVCNAIADRGDRSQLDLLFRALERGVPEAAEAIGRIGEDEAVATFHTHLERLPLGAMLSGYRRFLLRDDIATDTKLDIVARLGEVASPSVKHFLKQIAMEEEAAEDPRLKLALYETAKRIDPDPAKDEGPKPPPPDRAQEPKPKAEPKPKPPAREAP